MFPVDLLPCARCGAPKCATRHAPCLPACICGGKRDHHLCHEWKEPKS